MNKQHILQLFNRGGWDVPTTEDSWPLLWLWTLKMVLIFPKCDQVPGLLPQSVEEKEVIYPASLCPWAVEGTELDQILTYRQLKLARWIALLLLHMFNKLHTFSTIVCKVSVLQGERKVRLRWTDFPKDSSRTEIQTHVHPTPATPLPPPSDYSAYSIIVTIITITNN